MRKFKTVGVLVDPKTFSPVIGYVVKENDDDMWQKFGSHAFHPSDMNNDTVIDWKYIEILNNMLTSGNNYIGKPQPELTMEEIGWFFNHRNTGKLLSEKPVSLDEILKLSGVDAAIVKNDSALFDVLESVFKLIAETRTLQGPYTIERIVHEYRMSAFKETYFKIKHHGVIAQEDLPVAITEDDDAI